MSEFHDAGIDVGQFRMRPGVIADLEIQPEGGSEVMRIELGEPCVTDEYTEDLFLASVRFDESDSEQSVQAVIERDAKIQRYKRIALTSAAGAVIVAGVVTGIRLWHRKDVQN